MGSPRVLFTSHSPVISGAEVVLLEILEDGAGRSVFLFQNGPLAEALRSRPVDVLISRWGGDLSTVKRDRSLLRALPLALPILAMMFEIARHARSHDIVYANSQKAFILSAVATAFARRPLIWHLHDIPDATHFGKAQLRLQIGLANRRATRVVVPSEAVRDGFVAAGGRAELVTIVPNGVKPHPPDIHKSAALRQSLALPDGPIIGVFSRLAAWKGQDVVLHALAKLPGVCCIFAGSALFGEESYAAELEALAQRLGVSDRVLFLGQRSDVAALLRAVDIVVHPSTAPEPFGLTVVEAMFAGTPIVATAIGAIPDILDGGRAGTMIPPRDPDALARAIERVLSDPASGRVTTELARERVENLYTADRMRSAISDLILSVHSERPL